MVNLVKEIAQRVTLYDIIQQAKKTDQLVQDIEDEGEKTKASFYYLTRHACRSMFRVAGNLEVALAGYFGYTAATVDPDQVPMCVLLGLGGVLTYLADYAIFDKMNPLPTTKDDQNEPQ